MEKDIKLLICNSKHNGEHSLTEMAKVLPILSDIFETKEDNSIGIKENQYWNHDNCNNRFNLIKDVLYVEHFVEGDTYYDKITKRMKDDYYGAKKSRKRKSIEEKISEIKKQGKERLKKAKLKEKEKQQKLFQKMGKSLFLIASDDEQEYLLNASPNEIKQWAEELVQNANEDGE